MSLHDFTVYHLFEYNARYRGDSLATVDAQRLLSHRDFLRNVDQLAAGMVGRGIRKGDRVCVLAQNSIEFLELYGACAKIGAIAYPLNWRLSAAEVRAVVELADPHMLVVGAGQLEGLAETDLSGLRVRAILGEAAAAGFTPFGELYLDAVGEVGDVGGDDPFVIISTAAVAGVPRGAVLTHNNLILAGYQLIAALRVNESDRCLAALPLFHITGLQLALAAFQVGGANVVLQKFDPVLAVRLMDEHKVTYMADFPPILKMLLDAREQSGATWDSLKYVFGLDAPDVIQRLQAETNARFWTGFGQSETTGSVTMLPADERPGSAGRPLPSVRLRCVDELGADVPVGEPGEIVVRGPLVFAGYWRDPDATEFAFRHGWHHTGDIGKLDAEGYLYYVGRKPEKELIKSGGENVYPAEVEQALQELPQVAAACVIGVPDEKWGEAVKAVVELAPGASMTAEQVSAAVAERIAAFKKPRFVDFVHQMPRQEGGDIDRAAVKAAHGGAR